jgi:hypothetical protein
VLKVVQVLLALRVAKVSKVSLVQREIKVQQVPLEQLEIAVRRAHRVKLARQALPELEFRQVELRDKF